MNFEESPRTKKFDLEERLIDYSVLITGIVETMPNTRAGNHFAGQLIRSGTSPALNYAEAQVGVPCSILTFQNTEQGTPNDEF